MPSNPLRLLWLAVTAALFAGWIACLAYFVVQRRHAEVLPRAPFLVADLNVVVSIPDPKGPVTVKQVLWAREPRDGQGLEGKTITVTNLAECADWHGAGDYLLPLLKTGAETYEVADATGLPEATRRDYVQDGHTLPSLSPGYDPDVDPAWKTIRPPHLYPATRETITEVRQIHPPQ